LGEEKSRQHFPATKDGPPREERKSLGTAQGRHGRQQGSEVQNKPNNAAKKERVGQLRRMWRNRAPDHQKDEGIDQKRLASRSEGASWTRERSGKTGFRLARGERKGKQGTANETKNQKLTSWRGGGEVRRGEFSRGKSPV